MYFFYQFPRNIWIYLAIRCDPIEERFIDKRRFVGRRHSTERMDLKTVLTEGMEQWFGG